MQRSTSRILTTHTGSLPRPPDLIRTMFVNKGNADKLSVRPEGVAKSQVKKLGVLGAAEQPAERDRVVAVARSRLPVRPLVRQRLDHRQACGFRRVEFRVDARNARSQAAMAKLGATREGVLRADRITWTGHVRDTVLFSILAEEWPRLAIGAAPPPR